MGCSLVLDVISYINWRCIQRPQAAQILGFLPPKPPQRMEFKKIIIILRRLWKKPENTWNLVTVIQRDLLSQLSAGPRGISMPSDLHYLLFFKTIMSIKILKIFESFNDFFFHYRVKETHSVYPLIELQSNLPDKDISLFTIIILY